MYKLVAAILLGNGVGGRMATAPHYKLVKNGWSSTSLSHICLRNMDGNNFSCTYTFVRKL